MGMNRRTSSGEAVIALGNGRLRPFNHHLNLFVIRLGEAEGRSSCALGEPHMLTGTRAVNPCLLFFRCSLRSERSEESSEQASPMSFNSAPLKTTIWINLANASPRMTP